MKQFTVKHRYKRWQIVEIIKWHLYIKKPLQKFMEHIYKENKEDIRRKQLELMLYGRTKYPG